MYRKEIYEGLKGLLPDVAEGDVVESDTDYADFCVPCFKFAKTLKTAPTLIAKTAAEKFCADDIEASALNGYLNFSIGKARLARDVLSGVCDAVPDTYKGKVVCVDYASVNVAKPLHIGHLPSTVIGGSLCRIYDFLGAKTVGINHVGDWGTQFGNLITAYRRWGSEKALSERGLSELLDLYVRFHAEEETDETLKQEGRTCFKAIEDGDSECVKLFERFRDITLEYGKRVFARIGVNFDSWNGEAFYNDKTQAVIDELLEKKIATESDGALIVDMKPAPALVRRSDGATLYITRDLAAAKYRKQTYNFDKCLYVVAYQQNLHFNQLFEVVRRMGYDWYKDMVHVAFGMVSVEGEALSTRKGKVVMLEDVLNAAVDKASAIIRERSPSLASNGEIAEAVGVGSVVFDMLRDSRIKDVSFSFDRALNFDGETAPYIQYTHARCNSVIEKAGKTEQNFDAALLDDGDSQKVLHKLREFVPTVVAAAEKYEPGFVARYCVKLAQLFNKFYVNCRIVTDDKKLTAARLALTVKVRDTLKKGLELILINAPEHM